MLAYLPHLSFRFKPKVKSVFNHCNFFPTDSQSLFTCIRELGSVEPVKTSPEKGTTLGLISAALCLVFLAGFCAMFADADKLLRDLSLEGNFEHDMYGRIVQTLPPASLPEELVLTSENFAERVGKYDRTAVMFYMSCKT